MQKKPNYHYRTQSGQRLGQLRQQRARERQRRRKLAIYGGGAALLLVAVAGVLIFKNARHGGEGEALLASSVSEAVIPEQDDISVNGISLSGLTKSEAKEKLLKEYPWNIKLSYDGETYPIDNVIANALDAFLDDIFASEQAGEYTFTPASDETFKTAAQATAKGFAEKWNVKAKNSSISEYDAANDKFLFTDGKPGKALDEEKLVSDLEAAVSDENYDAVLTASVNEVQPELNASAAREQYEKLATFTTQTTANEKRNTNVKLAAQALNGTIVQPGEEFSFNKVVGPRTAEKGYQEAAAYNSGEVVQEIGGGVCQMSSTLYHTAFQAGMKITYRRSHTFEPNYVTPGQDAAISWELPDFRFVNTSKSAIGIRASYSNRQATVAIYGVPVLEDGVSLSLSSEKVEELPPPEPTYIEDQTLEPGKEVVQKAGTNGSRWITYRIVSKDGKEVERTEDHAKTYKGHAPVIRRNTSGVVLKPNETTAAPQTTVSPTVDGMPDDYVPGQDKDTAPESSAPALPPAETKPAETPATQAPTTQAAAKAPETTEAEGGVGQAPSGGGNISEMPGAPAESPGA